MNAVLIPLAFSLFTPPAPPSSAGHALVFHDSLQAVLLVNAGLGGMTSPPASTKTVLWQWTGRAWVVLDSSGPPIRNLAGVAYDVKRNALVMFGGSYDQSLTYDETWEWLQRGGWVKRNAVGPGKRDHTQVAYDAVHQRVILSAARSWEFEASIGWRRIS